MITDRERELLREQGRLLREFQEIGFEIKRLRVSEAKRELGRALDAMPEAQSMLLTWRQ